MLRGKNQSNSFDTSEQLETARELWQDSWVTIFYHDNAESTLALETSAS